MRKITILSLMLLTSVSFAASCGGGDDGSDVKTPEQKGTITVTPAEMTATSDAQQVKFKVTADVDWSVHTDASWISLFPSGGVKNTPTDITASIQANTGMDARVGVVTVKSGGASQTFTLTQSPLEQLELPFSDFRVSHERQLLGIAVEANTAWTAFSATPWIMVKKDSGHGIGTCEIMIEANDTDSDRQGTVTFSYGASGTATAVIRQFTAAIDVPAGYRLVWNDEFNDDRASISDLWSYDIKGPGWVNNELQRYVAGEIGGVKTAEIHDGMLTITASKVGGEVVSARLNSKQGWTYGIFEARLCLPKGKGTWPAFWMYPSRPDGSWPYCGEIDIMEEVGCVPNEVSSSIHCKAYNHTINTQKTAKRTIAGAEDDFHVYRLEWTEDYIRTFVDGQQLFNFPNDKKGNRDTWPYDYDFKIILNLAWGGDWGGMWGVDESALPVTYDIDYVRVFQKE